MKKKLTLKQTKQQKSKKLPSLRKPRILKKLAKMQRSKNLLGLR